MTRILAEHPSISILGLAEDGSEVLVKRTDTAIWVMADPSLSLLLELMQGGGQQGPAAEEGK